MLMRMDSNCCIMILYCFICVQFHLNYDFYSWASVEIKGSAATDDFRLPDHRYCQQDGLGRW